MKNPGKLYIVATPIGNLEDITLRALTILKQADAILCEDTRVTSKLLNKFEFKTPLISHHEHSNLKKQEQILERLKKGETLALTTDAGTPGISDPGNKLVSQVLEKVPGVKIESIPGASALTAIISVAGIDLSKFLFFGFLPHKKGRQTLIKEIRDSKYPVIVYESKYRVLKLLKQLEENNMANNNVVIGRELTKMHEEIFRGKVIEIKEKLEEKTSIKGEFVLIIQK